MNNWQAIWQKKGADFQKRENVFDMFCELKKASGFDLDTSRDSYQSFYDCWQREKEYIENAAGHFDSVFEVGCGSGANLYLFRELCGITDLGGIDYSESLVRIARSILGDCIEYREASDLSESPRFDVVLSDSVFQYFESVEYGMEVLQKMYEKAERAIVIRDISDIEKKEEMLMHRRSIIQDYDRRYKGLDRTFYSREKFRKFAEEHNCELQIVNPVNKSYWNNDYVFDCYFTKLK